MGEGCPTCLDTSLSEDGSPCPDCHPEGDEYLPHNVKLVEGQYIATCCVCERDIEVHADELPADGDDFYCCGSERCLP